MRITTLALVTAFVSLQAWAFPGGEAFEMKMPIPQSAPCAQMTGRWAGVCTTDGVGSKKARLIIEQQNCYVVKVNELVLLTGGKQSVTNEASYYNSELTSTVDWNSDRSGLVGSWNFSDQVTATGAARDFSGEGETKLAGGFLIGEYVTHLSTGDVRTHCKYKRVL